MPKVLRSWCAVCLVVGLTAGLLLLAGCSDSGNKLVFQNVSERCSWSVDALIAFASFGGNGLRYVNSVNENGRSLRVLTPSDNDDDLTDEGGYHPCYSPDGLFIYFASRRDTGAGAPSVDIFRMDAGDGANLVQLTGDATDVAGQTADDSMPCIAPDGSKIAWISNRSIDGLPHVWIMDPDGSNKQQLTKDTEDAWPQFSPAADYIVYQSKAVGSNDTDLAVMDVAGSIGAVLTAANTPSREEAPAWSPVGNTILFHSNRSGDFDIYATTLTFPGGVPTASAPVQLTADARADGFPNWKPDGTQFVFTRDREVWIADADGSNQEQLTRRF